ncbi:unnamed protein product [Owenia fusiformis]|uniref:Uncharacterized protein n=1 Tax=Owenia fusiformis TaxID=6347 RepID=A0A8J1UR45_OWEFU|nr:unnamed protein product [Owenia fusiformis]
MQNCYGSGRVPREVQGDQEERLTTKHIQTLSFLQDIANENKELKVKIDDLEAKLAGCAELHSLAENSQERIKQIQEQYMNRSDEINAMLTEKHKAEYMTVVEDKLELERQLELQTGELRIKLETMVQTNKILQDQLDLYKNDEAKMKVLILKVETQNAELVQLREENAQLKLENANQVKEIEKLQGQMRKSGSLGNQLAEAQQKGKELQIKLETVLKELKESQNSPQQDKDLVDKLKNKLGKLNKERSVFESREKEHLELIAQLKLELDTVNGRMEIMNMEKEELIEEVKALSNEIEFLKRRSSVDQDKQAFKEFVKVKRELNSLRAENFELKGKLKSRASSFPSLKSTSDTRTFKGSVK